LLDSVLDGLPRERVLELGCENGDAVQENGQVEALGRLFAVAELTDDGKKVRRMEALQGLVEPARWTKIGQLELAARVLEAVPQDVERARGARSRG